MENRRYKVCRDNIFVGEVVRTHNIYRYEGDTGFIRVKPRQLDVGSWFSYRTMLFVPNEKKLSNDLLYRSPSYPILNVTDDETCLGLEGENVVIKDACNLAALLEYFGYDKDLTFKDIMRIRKTFFTGKFAMDNCELFGWKECKPEDSTYYKNGVEVTNPRELKKIIARERRSRERTFTSVSEGVLPREYWDVLDKLGDNDLIDAIEWHEKMDAFAPHKEEGRVKRLTRL